MNDRRHGDTIAIEGSYQYKALREGRAPQRFWHAKRFDEAERLLNPKPGDHCLDVGCGSAIMAERMARTKGTTVVGIDTNSAAIEFAKRTHQRDNLRFKLGLVDELDFPDASVDKVAFLEILEHISRPQGVSTLQGLYRVLKPGGRLVISTPNRISMWPVVEWALDTFELVPTLADEQHVALYSRGQMRKLASETGFEIPEMRTIHTIAPWVTPISESLANGLHRIDRSLCHPFGCIIVAAFDKPSGPAP